MLVIIKKYRKYMISMIAILLFIALWVLWSSKTHEPYAMGATLHNTEQAEEKVLQTIALSDDEKDLHEQFQRPSKSPPLDTKYVFQDFIDSLHNIPRFENPEDLLKAYFAILKEASSMEGFHGGCGSIGAGQEPFSYAYQLLSPETRKHKTLAQFTQSFKGIGHTTLLKLQPAYSPKNAPSNLLYYFLEFEIITGPPITSTNKKTPQPSYFAYYYGLATVENTTSEGWKIKAVDLIPEDFLCAPYHSWFWDGEAVVEIIYQNWYKLIEKIDRVETKDSQISIYASGYGKEYRFDFVQLTNGHQVMLHENIRIGGTFQETNILKPDHQNFKLSILNPMLSH